MRTTTEFPLLTDRFQDALVFAARIHARDPRKGTTIPYMAHLLGVCALILTDGGTEDEAIAGLLHDTLEDHPGEVRPEALERRFGPRVRSLVEGCTDTPPGFTGGPKPPEALRVSLADKLDNVRAILADYRQIGEEIWSRFSAPRGKQLWYYHALVDAFRRAHPPGRLLEPFAECVAELERRAGGRAASA